MPFICQAGRISSFSGTGGRIDMQHLRRFPAVSSACRQRLEYGLFLPPPSVSGNRLIPPSVSSCRMFSSAASITGCRAISTARFYLVLQFTHVSRPPVGKHQPTGFGREPFRLPLEFFGKLLPEVFCQRQDVFRAFMQRRHDYLELTQPVVQVLAETPLP